jgi:signal recognition particle subunit SEC65
MPDHFFVYPTYVKQGVTRALGRRVPSRLAVADATLSEIAEATTTLGFVATAEPEKQYPREVSTYAGRLKVVKQPGVSKAEFLRRLAMELARKRAAGATH